MRKQILVAIVLVLLTTIAMPTQAVAQTAPHKVVLTWTAATDQISTSVYNVYRYKGQCTDATVLYTLVATTPADAVTYTDTGVLAGTSYCYTVTQLQGSAESVKSNTTQAIVPGPNAPSGLSNTSS